MRKVLVIFLLLFIPAICWGYALRIGNVSIPAYTEKHTTPSFNIMTDTGDVYHIPMTPQNIYGTLRVSDRNGVIYSACVGEKTHVGKYWFIGNCLVDADDDVYLESTGTQYIDTGYKPWAQNFGYYFDGIIHDTGGSGVETPGGVYDRWKAGNPALSLAGNYSRIAYRSGILGGHNLGWNAATRNLDAQFDHVDNGVRGFVSVMNNNDYDGTKSTITTRCTNCVVPYVENVTFSPDVRTNNNFTLYAINNGGTVYQFAKLRIYNVAFYEHSTKVRNFIPVPAGMVIGNYTVPSNGMWDVVGQKFYGNSGTGDFIYGVDE